MMDGLDFFNVCFMGSIEVLMGFHFFTKFLQRKVRFIYYIVFVVFGIAVMVNYPAGSMMEFFVYILLLIAAGIMICKTYNVFIVLYAVVTIEIMHLCYGIFNSLSCILFPLVFSGNPENEW